jgi:hypothetical protein
MTETRAIRGMPARGGVTNSSPGKPLDHVFDRVQQEASDEERENPEWDLQREAENEARLKRRLKRKALCAESAFEQLRKEKRERRQDEEDDCRRTTPPRKQTPSERDEGERQREPEKDR